MANAGDTATGSLRFAAQAARYDHRAGLPPGIAEQIAVAIYRHVVDQPITQPPTLLELAAGTGEIGAQLCRYFNYTAVEGAAAMLEQFHLRLQTPTDTSATTASQHGQGSAQPAPAVLHHADANQRWPVADRSQHAVFISRAAHLLDPVHLHSELQRVTRPGALLILGRVNKDPQSAASQLRQRLHHLLRKHGHSPRRGGRTHRRLAQTMDTQAQQLTVASWQITEQPLTVIDHWRAKPGLAGVMMNAAEQSKILRQLQDEAAELFPSLEQAVSSTREYQLTLIRIHTE